MDSSDPASFPWSVFHDRHPVLIERIAGALPRPAAHHDALDALLAESTSGVVSALDVESLRHEHWPWWRPEYRGLPWGETPFLWAESYFYRRVLDAVGYFVPGLWRGLDPFGPIKAAELAGSSVSEELAALDDVAALPADEQWSALVGSALWGNRADLSFQAGPTASEATGGLIADDSDALRGLLHDRPPGEVHVLADNAGREVLPDLVLIEHLLSAGLATAVVLHVKPFPYYVSDATPADVWAAVARLRDAGGRAGEVGGRLFGFLRTGRLGLEAHEFFCGPLTYDAMPSGLREQFAGASLTISKGDLNYRRLVGDRHWHATAPFEELTAHFPGPLAALRTLKCDVAVGLTEETVRRLDGTGKAWRTTGEYAVIHVRG
ncbi:protein-glutamate O-methyltransferase family protein [Cryptosporangium phraense]|uniref:Protein-glutamate O-methyltransferase family protein n=1 Tax=Cryptosporangium phraense TaxID=2593070 RepID=A0A545AJJ5_9ACTN|nr:protein-glutamate O-methyltransferase family protein [Cryptosporangium phraense]